MNDTSTHAASAADTQAKKPELKSTDTGVFGALKKADTATPQPKATEPAVQKPEAKKPVSDASPAVTGPDAESSEAEHQDDDRKIEPWMRKRLARAEDKGRKLARAELLEEMRAARAPEQQAPSTEEPAASSAPAAKTLADFDYDMEKYADHLVDRKLQAKEADQEKKRAEAAAREARTAFDKHKAEFEARVGEGAWEEMTSIEVDVPQPVIDLLKGHAKDLDIAHYLVHHPDELNALRGKSNLEIAASLAAIDAKLGKPRKANADADDDAVALPPKTTKAPPPPPKLPGAGSATKDIANMTTGERIAEWRRQKQARQKSA